MGSTLAPKRNLLSFRANGRCFSPPWPCSSSRSSAAGSQGTGARRGAATSTLVSDTVRRMPGLAPRDKEFVLDERPGRSRHRRSGEATSTGRQLSPWIRRTASSDWAEKLRAGTAALQLAPTRVDILRRSCLCRRAAETLQTLVCDTSAPHATSAIPSTTKRAGDRRSQDLHPTSRRRSTKSHEAGCVVEAALERKTRNFPEDISAVVNRGG